MRPNFALTLSEDGIGLLHRAKGGWRSLGEVSLDDPGLSQTLRLMRETAQSLSDGPLRTKLIIPDSQILYTTQPLVGANRAEKRAGLRRALDGLTPYALDDLVFDWTDDGETARLAVVARETLEEAEGFVRAHAFNPVCFVAAPKDKALFDGEPFFGPTESAVELLEKGARPKADTHAARPGEGPAPRAGSKARAKPAAAKAKPSATAPTPPKQPAGPDTAAGGPSTATTPPAAPARAQPADVAKSPAPTFTTRRADTAAGAEGPPKTTPASAPAPRRLDLVRASGEAASAPPSKPAPASPPASREAATSRTAPPAARPAPSSPPAMAPAPQARTSRPVAPRMRAAVSDTLQRAQAGLGQARDLAAKGAQLLPKGRADRGAASETPEPRKPALGGVSAADLAARARGTMRKGLTRARSGLQHGLERAQAVAEKTRRSGPVQKAAAAVKRDNVVPKAPKTLGTTRPWPESPDPGLHAPSAKSPAPAGTPGLRERLAAAGSKVVGLPKDLGDRSGPAPKSDTLAAEAAPPGAARRVPPAPRPTDPLAREADPTAPGAVVLPPPRTETEALTIFGARRNEPLPAPPGAAMRGILLGGALLVAIGGIGAAFLFFGGERQADPTAEIAALPQEIVAPPADAPEQQPAAPTQAVPEAPAPLPEEPAPQDAAEPPAPQTAEPPELSPLEAAEAYAATGLWQRAPEAPVPPREGRIDDLYLAAIDPAIRPPQKVGLPDPEAQLRTDTAPPPQRSPRAAPAPAALEEPAEVETAPDGAEPPISITVTPGRPAAVPPARPEELGPDIPETVVMAPSVAVATRLAPFRPRLRPAGLTPAAVAPKAPTEEAPEVPALRPLDRPDALAPAEEAAPPAPDAAETPEDEAAVDVAPDEDETGSALALTRSPQPRARPAAVAEKVAALGPAVPAEAAAVAPSIPTSASVAQQATLPNALNLRRLSLIGVYGSDSDRRALVRLPTGRYVKVQVGDRVDGGQVAAIGEDSLRYVKGGRSTVLDLPGG